MLFVRTIGASRYCGQSGNGIFDFCTVSRDAVFKQFLRALDPVRRLLTELLLNSY